MLKICLFVYEALRVDLLLMHVNGQRTVKLNIKSPNTEFLYTENMNLPFEKHEEDLWVCRNVFYRGRAGANLTSHNIAEQMDHILLPLHSNNHSDWVLICTVFWGGFCFGHRRSNQACKHTLPLIIQCVHQPINTLNS